MNVDNVRFGTIGGSHGLVVMGGDSQSKGHGFESEHHTQDGHDIFHLSLL